MVYEHDNSTTKAHERHHQASPSDEPVANLVAIGAKLDSNGVQKAFAMTFDGDKATIEEKTGSEATKFFKESARRIEVEAEVHANERDEIETVEEELVHREPKHRDHGHGHRAGA